MYQLSILSYPDVRFSESCIWDVLGVKDGILRNLDVIAQLGIEIQSNVSFIGGITEVPLQQESIWWRVRIFNDLRHEIGHLELSFLFRH